MIAMDREDRNCHIDIWVFVIDMVESTAMIVVSSVFISRGQSRHTQQRLLSRR
jgi:hypothetical protein